MQLQAGGFGAPNDARVIRWRQWVDRGFSEYQAGRIESAQTLWLRAGRAGDMVGAYNAAVLRFNGESTWPRPREAVDLLMRSAQSGLPAAQRMLATLHDEGRLPDASLVQAARWYRAAAEAGDVDAQRSLAGMYLLGRGVAADDGAAAHWYARAAEAGDLTAQYVIASFYERGHGVAADAQQAMQWYAAAARQGDIVAGLKAREMAARMAREQAAP